jgi:hypothetical protein
MTTCAAPPRLGAPVIGGPPGAALRYPACGVTTTAATVGWFPLSGSLFTQTLHDSSRPHATVRHRPIRHRRRLVLLGPPRAGAHGAGARRDQRSTHAWARCRRGSSALMMLMRHLTNR